MAWLRRCCSWCAAPAAAQFDLAFAVLRAEDCHPDAAAGAWPARSAAARRAKPSAARMDRRRRRLRPSADAGCRDPRGGGEFPLPASKASGRWRSSRNVPRQVFDKLMAGVTPDLRIMDLLDSQPEFTKAPWEYLDILVTDARIADGRAILAKHRAAFDSDGAGLRRRPPRHRGDLGHRVRTTARRSATAR